MISSFKKIIFLCFLFVSLSSQDQSYIGNLSFNYSGTASNYFSSIMGDSMMTTIAYNQDNGDSSYFLLAAITQQDSNEFDLFLTALRDTVFPLQSRSWSIPGEGEENNPLSLEAVLVLMPGLDSSFVLNFFNTFSDTSGDQSPDELFTEIFNSLSDQMYLGLQGDLDIQILEDSTIVGSFNSTLFKPAFHIPPHFITIGDGQFSFNRLNTPTLQIENIPKIESFYLIKAYPNPFNPIVNLEIMVELKSNISLKIYNLKGQLMTSVFEGNLNPGLKRLQWDATKFSSGIYFSVLKNSSRSITKKIILNK